MFYYKRNGVVWQELYSLRSRFLDKEEEKEFETWVLYLFFQRASLNFQDRPIFPSSKFIRLYAPSPVSPRQKVDKSLKQIDEGKVISHEEVKQRISKWIK